MKKHFVAPSLRDEARLAEMTLQAMSGQQIPQLPPP